MEIFKQYNNNPNNLFTQDCVIRALTSFLNKPYNDIIDDLVNIYKQTGFHIADPVCFFYYLNNLHNIYCIEVDLINNIKLKTLCEDIINKNFSNWKTLNEYNTNKVLAFLGNTHLTCLHSGVIKDIWDCSNENINKIYIFKGDEFNS